MILEYSLILVIVSLITSIFIILYVNARTNNDPRNIKFRKGKFPSPLPNGLYKGSVKPKQSSWLGKKFDRKDSTGINIFRGNKERYPFKTYKAPGRVDKDIEVLKIDYDMHENPIWLRFVLDEIVQVGKDKYLGKIHLRMPLGQSIVLGYFELIKS